MTERPSGCTWVDCGRAAAFPQIAKDGEQWANLCAEHNEEIEAAIGALDARKVLGCWVKAMGGSKKATERMMR